MAAPSLLREMRFRHEWRKYQRLILDRFEHRDPAKRTFHVVAPPGAGKTLVGLEIINRLDAPAVTFSPTTTIQEQWRDKVRMFLGDRPDPELLAQARAGPASLGEMTSLTYQSLSTQGEEDEFLRALGHEALVEELIADQVSEEGASRQVDQLRKRSPDVYAEQVRGKARGRQRELLGSGEIEVERLLHRNAVALLEELVARRIGCIILDEAHHLLDYWALILGELIRRLPDALVVGLTATPPHSAAPQGMQNYLDLVDGIDFEVPTPAVVRSGHLAPYQDLIRIVEPARAEREFLSSRHQLVEDAFEQAFSDSRFLPRLARRINRIDSEMSWSELLSDEFDFAVAGVRYLLHHGERLRDDIPVVHELRREPTHVDRRELLREWCQNVLRGSEEPGDEERLAEIRQALRALGIVLTAHGWRRQASPSDRVLAYSQSKFEAMVEILTAEAEVLGDRLRAVVITDYEKSSPTAIRPLRGVLIPAPAGPPGRYEPRSNRPRPAGFGR